MARNEYDDLSEASKERLAGFAFLLPIVTNALMAGEEPIGGRSGRLEQVRNWFSMVWSKEGYKSIGMRLQEGSDFEILELSGKKRCFRFRHIGSGVIAEAKSFSEAEQELTRAVNGLAMDLHHEIRRDPWGVLDSVFQSVSEKLNR